MNKIVIVNVRLAVLAVGAFHDGSAGGDASLTAPTPYPSTVQRRYQSRTKSKYSSLNLKIKNQKNMCSRKIFLSLPLNLLLNRGKFHGDKYFDHRTNL